MKTMDRIAPGRLIADSLHLSGKTQKQVAAECGCYEGTIQKMTIGMDLTGVERFFRLADALDVYPEDLIAWWEDEKE